MPKNIFEINNDKNIKVLGNNLINKTLKPILSIKKSIKYYLIAKVIISSLNNYCPLIIFFNPHYMINTCEI